MIKHRRTEHEGVSYKCEICQVEFSQTSHLVRHRRAKYETVRYLCDQYAYQATQQHELKVHQESVLEGVRYECEKGELNFDEKYKMVKSTEELNIKESDISAKLAYQSLVKHLVCGNTEEICMKCRLSLYPL